VSHSFNLHIKAILFDLDATLADTWPIYEQAFVKTFRDVLGVELDDQKRRRYMGLPTIDFLMEYAEGEDLQTLSSTLTEQIHQLMPQVQLFAGLEKILPELQGAGIRLGVVTSQSRVECNLTRQYLNIDQWIQVWITTEDVEWVKPDPQPVQAALSALNVKADQAVMVGDNLYDLHAGRAAGTQVGIAVWGTDDLDHLLAYEPDFIFRTPMDLRILISKHGVENQAGIP
jgi:pyrophosphatase PpaX